MLTKVGLFFVTAFVFLENAQGKDLILCPHPGQAKNLVYENTINTPMQGSSIVARIPDVYFLDSPMTCLCVLDNNDGVSQPVISDGGLDVKYAIVNILNEDYNYLSYTIRAYTADEGNSGSVHSESHPCSK
ncbi:uncharacterized protein LOC114325743 isoform X1 [Diabrotica virgifera virgifera]|uniref:Uncharacterized protein n=1 Tax=Diabrotica virgifera virgifera TaxID=50390 RepID=A0ABM5IC92_DIAVI|nr:uncharacterized protein LOC114325743 isoform X1 [Diabrotica virgifera virgifera]